VLEALKSGASSDDGPNDTMSRLNGSATNHIPDTAPVRNPSSLQRERSEHIYKKETQSSDEVCSTGTSPIVHAVLQPSEVIVAMDSGIDAFFSCTGCVFHIYGQDEAHRLLSTIRPHILQDSWLVQLKVSLCSVCIMAAVGLQYTTDAIPGPRLDASAENGMHKYITIFYELTKYLMEIVIENDVIEAMKVCAALCVFNSIEHVTVALAYAGTWSGLRICVTSIDYTQDMGMNLALDSRPEFYPVSLENTAWVDYKRVLRTLVSLRRYVELLICDCMTFTNILKLAWFDAGIYAR
jgi:hypothetical protein